MGLKLFGRTATTALVLSASLQALVDNETVTAEQVDAANHDLADAGVKGAQLVPSAVLEELTEKAGRTDAAEQQATQLQEQLTAATTERDTAQARVKELEAKPGATSTTPVRRDAAESEVEETTDEKETQKAIGELPHNKALAGHPIFG